MYGLRPAGVCYSIANICLGWEEDVARPREEMMTQWVPALADSAFVNWYRAPTAIAVAGTHCMLLHDTLRLFVMTSHC